MSSDRRLRYGALLVGLVLAAGACADFKRGPRWDGEMDDGGDGDTGAPGEGLSYAEAIDELMISGCDRCHGEGESAAGTGFVLTTDVDANYATCLDFVDLDAPESSRLLSKGAGQGHGGGTIYDSRSSEYATILQWIEEGAAP